MGWQPTGKTGEALPWHGEAAALVDSSETDQEQAGVEWCPILGSEGGVLTGVGLLTVSVVGKASSMVTAWPAGRWRLLTSRRGAVRRSGPHGVVAGLEEDRRQRCTWRNLRQLGRRGAIGDRPEERSMVSVDGSVGNVVAGLGCGITERRGAAVD
jgi:hypothetical protein